MLVYATGHSGDPAHLVATAKHYMLDGSVTMISSYTCDPIFEEPRGPMRAEVAVPFEQLDVLAGDPHLALRQVSPGQRRRGGTPSPRVRKYPGCS